MKTGILAVSITLLILALIAIPGETFCISSSVTSYNNTITIIESGGGGDSGDPSDIKLNIRGFIIGDNPNPNMGGGYEICVEGEDFFTDGGIKAITFTAIAGCSIQIYVNIVGTGGVQTYINGIDIDKGLRDATGNGFISNGNTLITSSNQSPGAWTAILEAGNTMSIFALGSGPISIALVFV